MFNEKKISSRYSFNFNIILCCRLGQGAQALNKAIDSGDTDLIYHVILTLQVIFCKELSRPRVVSHVSGFFYLRVIRNWP
jgi:hypothetical protein